MGREGGLTMGGTITFRGLDDMVCIDGSGLGNFKDRSMVKQRNFDRRCNTALSKVNLRALEAI